MLETGIYALYDKTAKIFTTPFFVGNDPTAARQFKDIGNDPQTIVHKHPEDFTLYRFGTWRPAEGKMEVLSEPFKIFEGRFINKENNNNE